MGKISVVISPFNEEKNIAKAISSVKNLADEIVVVDMGSTDRTAEVAKKLGAKVYTHPKVEYVELIRNFSISKAKGEWIFILDPDEEVSERLAKKIKDILKKPSGDYYRVPRKNIIFDKWIKYSRWWPDYNIRLFKKGNVSWSEEIHAVPFTKGKGIDLPSKEEFSIIHYNYKDINSYLEKMTRYTLAQSQILMKNGYVFSWHDLIKKPMGEFFSRFFAGEGYRDGVHGLALSLLQSFSELVLYLRVWEAQGFKKEELKKDEIKSELNKSIKDLKWWIGKKFSWLSFLKSQ